MNADRSAAVRVLAVAALLFVAWSGGTPAAQSAAQDPSRAARLVMRWTIIVKLRLEDSKATAADEVLELVDEFLSVGAVQAVRDSAGEAHLQKADTGVTRLVAAMVNAGDRQADGSVTLDEDAFQAGRTSVCPLYPFCSKE